MPTDKMYNHIASTFHEAYYNCSHDNRQ